MHIETMQDMVNWSAEFHDAFAAFLLDSVASSKSERLKMLSEYIADHERNLANTLRAFTPTERDQALGTWCAEFLNEQPLPDTKTVDSRWGQMATDELFNQVENIHSQLIDLYEFVLSRCQATPAAAMLQQLIDIEAHELKLMAHSANRLQDI